jgi:hypothetical protein
MAEAIRPMMGRIRTIPLLIRPMMGRIRTIPLLIRPMMYLMQDSYISRWQIIILKAPINVYNAKTISEIALYILHQCRRPKAFFNIHGI